MAKKRKARKEDIKKVDLLKPINIADFGSKNDPCFGKLHDPKHPTCQRCGDIELCAIKFGQTNHKKREKMAEDTTFLDIGEEKIDKMKKNTQIRQLIKRIVKKEKSISEKMLKEQVMAGMGITEKKFKARLKKLLEGSKRVIKKGNKIQYK